MVTSHKVGAKKNRWKSASKPATTHYANIVVMLALDHAFTEDVVSNKKKLIRKMSLETEAMCKPTAQR